MNLSSVKSEQQRRYNPTVEMKWIDHLPRDLIIEILSRLSPKDLCKFRCVSKSWQDLLTRDMEFTARHIQYSKQKPLLLVRKYLSDGIMELNKSKITIELISIDMQGNITDKFSEIIDGPVNTFVSCGPLSILCCMHTLYVCNPSVRQIVRVPYHSNNARLYNIAFGYLPVSNEYKIVHMFFNGNEKMGCEIFSFRSGENVGSGSWRRIMDCPFSAWTDEYPMCINGTIYWAVSSGWKDKSILCLDLEKEEFSSVCYPMHESKKYSFLEYIGLMGDLCVVGFCAEESIIDVWMLKDKKKKIWKMDYSINLYPLCPKFLIPCDDQSEDILVHLEQRDLICYSLKSQSYRRIEYYKAMRTYNKPCLYYGSLISVNVIGT
ncbi:hypothetical protein DH2020_026403 [Rehmannia glutinosa]|uniref:F-box domain-containing protein n=1 Tax=Rehmannia glutinosa TaxID=99300 RepID=A0ABR0VX28_REHGL